MNTALAENRQIQIKEIVKRDGRHAVFNKIKIAHLASLSIFVVYMYIRWRKGRVGWFLICLNRGLAL